MESQSSKGMRWVALVTAAIVYAGAVVYGDIMFLSVMQDTFPSGILGALAMGGAIMTAASALILPLALHFWFAPGKQFIVGVIFWLVDIVVLALNSMLAYAVATGSGMLATWAAFAPATPLLAVFGWGVMFLLDPSHKLRHAQLELESDLIDIHAEQLRQAAKDAAVSATIKSGAKSAAEDMASRLTGIRTTTPRNAGKQPPTLPAQTLDIASNTNGNGHHAYESDMTLPALDDDVLANPTPRRRSKP